MSPSPDTFPGEPCAPDPHHLGSIHWLLSNLSTSLLSWGKGGHFSLQYYKCPKCQAEDDSSPPSAVHTPPPSVPQHALHFVWDEQNCGFIFLLVTSCPLYTHNCQWGVKCMPDHIKLSVDIQLGKQISLEKRWYGNLLRGGLQHPQHPTASPELRVLNGHKSPLNFQCSCTGSLRQALHFVTCCF